MTRRLGGPSRCRRPAGQTRVRPGRPSQMGEQSRNAYDHPGAGDHCCSGGRHQQQRAEERSHPPPNSHPNGPLSQAKAMLTLAASDPTNDARVSP